MDINAGSMSSRGSVQYVRSRSSTPLSRGSSSVLSRAESESYEGEEVDLPPEDMPEQGIPPSGRSRPNTPVRQNRPTTPVVPAEQDRPTRGAGLLRR